MTFWQFLSSVEGWMSAHVAEKDGEGLSGKEEDELWALVVAD
jgi:hypothetical protein